MINVRDKLDQCITEKLMELCEVLNIPISKSNTKNVCLYYISQSQLIDTLHIVHALIERQPIL